MDDKEIEKKIIEIEERIAFIEAVVGALSPPDSKIVDGKIYVPLR